MGKPEYFDAVRRMQEYIETHRDERITLYNLAQRAGYSPWYAAKLFRKLTGKTPQEYIRALRLSGAAMQLRDGSRRVLDIALDFAFDSHEGFTRAFSEKFGMTPQEYRRKTPPIPLFIAYKVMRNYPQNNGGTENMSEKFNYTVMVQVVNRPRRKMILKRGKEAKEYFAYCAEAGCEIWGLLSSIREALYEPVGVWLPESLRHQPEAVYAMAVEVPPDYDGEIPAGCDTIELPECQVAVFQGMPFREEQTAEAFKAVADAMSNYRPEMYGFEWDDEATPRFQLAPQEERGVIEARPVRKTGR